MILLVEDEARLARIILSKLEREGLPDVEWVRDAGALRAKFGGTRTQVLVMHTSLPDAEPLAMVEEIRAHPAWSEAPILILRDGFETQSAEAFLEAGAQQVIQKPFQPSALARAIRRLLDPTENGADARLERRG